MSRKKAKGLRQVDPQKTPKIWEKARRERMKIYFNELQEVLPLYDPSAPMSRFEVLQKSRSYIKDLQAQNQDLLNGGFDEVYKEKMEKMKQRIKELLRRVDQLTDLLRRAHIMIPPLLPYPENPDDVSMTHKWMNQRPKKWTEKINVVVPDEKIEKVLLMIKDSRKKTTKGNVGKKTPKKSEKSEKSSKTKEEISEVLKLNIFMEKGDEKKKKVVDLEKSDKVRNEASNCGSDNFTDSQSPSHTKENEPIDFNLPQTHESNKEVNSSVPVTQSNSIPGNPDLHQRSSVTSKISSNDVTENIVHKFIEPQNNMILPSASNVVQPNTFLLTNDGNLVQFPMLNSSNNVFNASSNILAQTAIVNPSITPLVINRPSPLIVLQKQATPQVIQTAQIVNPAPQILSVPKTGIQILGNSVVYATSTSNPKTLPYILSKPPANKKRITRDSTVTTYVNKIPIPALSKQSYAKKSVNLIGSKSKNVNGKSKETSSKTGESEKSKIDSTPNNLETIEKANAPNTSEMSKEKNMDKERESQCEEIRNLSQKRSISNAEKENNDSKKQKLSEEISKTLDSNVFKPIDNPLTTEMLCNLKLPDSINPSLSVSPTAAFLSSFPIVAPTKSDVDEDHVTKLTKSGEKRAEEAKESRMEEDPKEKENNPLETSQKETNEPIKMSKTNDSITNTSIIAETLFQPIEEKSNDQSNQITEITKICVGINSRNGINNEKDDITNNILIINKNINCTNINTISNSSSKINNNSSNNNKASITSSSNIDVSSSSSSNNHNNTNTANTTTTTTTTTATTTAAATSTSATTTTTTSITSSTATTTTIISTTTTTNNNNNNHNHNSNKGSNVNGISSHMNNNVNTSSDTRCINSISASNNNNNNESTATNVISICTESNSDISSSNSNIISSISSNTIINQTQQELTKSWTHYQHQKTCDVRSESFYVPPAPDSTIPFSDALIEITPYKNTYVQNAVKPDFSVPNNLNEQVPVKSNQFDYTQKENFTSKNVNFGDRANVKKTCANENYSIPKTQTSYHADPGPTYQLIPAKEINRNARPPVNWMTDPDVRSRSMNYASQLDKTSKPYVQPDTFYVNSQSQKTQNEYPTEFMGNDVNKMPTPYQKNDFYVNKSMESHMKQMRKPSDPKCLFKSSQNYNIFDYNYNSNCYPEDDSNKYCNIQGFISNTNHKSKKSSSIPHSKKKTDNLHHINSSNEPQTNDGAKRSVDHIIPSLDFNPTPNQECFSWVPGKNMEWLSSKAFGVDTNLVVPSTLPTLVGDLALGTNTTNEVVQSSKSKNCQANSKPNAEAAPKHYIELGLTNNFTKGVESPLDSNKQFLEPFTNLSKNIFDLTPSNNMQKNDFEKPSYQSNNSNNETIVLKNIFELPAAKSFGNDFTNQRTKQRNISHPQNNFLSVSQLVETPNFENNTIKNESCHSDTSKTNYPQNYPNYQNMKHYKNKARNSQYKYDRKYHNYKNTSSNYTAEALIRSNTNANFQNDFSTEVNSNFFSSKNNQTLVGNTNELNPKPDFIAPTQNLYTDFNFSSPVPNFNITSSMNTEFVNHDTNSSAQNNSFFGDFIPPEYPLTETVSNSLLLPPCSIGLQNPFIIDKRNTPAEKSSKTPTKNYGSSRNRKFECSKSSYNDFSIVHNTTGAIFTNATLSCPPIFTSSTCQNLLPVQNVSEANISFSGPSFTSNNIPFPPLSSNTNTNFHRFSTSVHNNTPSSFLSTSTTHSMFTTCSTTITVSSHSGFSTNSTSVTHPVITTPFSVGNTPFVTSTQSTLPFLSLSNPIIPPSVPTTSGNSLANFNLSTIFPEINQKGNYHYP